jgi:predicted butyrate kinase (DUF1464 family)
MSLPKRSDKDRTDLPDDLHARFLAAIRNERLLNAKPLAEVMKLDEAPRDAKVVVEIPDGTHDKLYRSIFHR